jgi:imidazolonepropionase-like amidohydrolase
MSEPRTVFTGANLIDGEHPAQPGMTVVVEGERIVSVAAGLAGGARPGDRIVPLAGRSLMPGMVQAHFHSHFGAFGEGVTAPALGLEAAPPYLSMLAAVNARTALHCGFTGAMGSSSAHGIDVCLKEAILLGVVEGPRYRACTRELVTTGEASDYPNNRTWFMELGNKGLTCEVDGADAWRHATRAELGRGADVVKISASPGHGSSPARDVMYLTREELSACVETAHKLGKKVRAHVASRTAILECARAGVDILDHADRIDEECIEAILEAGCVVVPSMLWTVRFLALAENWDHAQKPLPISEGHPEDLATTLARIRGVREDFEHTCRMMPEAHRAGVPMVVGDDYGTPLLPHGSYGDELELYVKQLGFAPLHVIRWATRNGAHLLGLGDQTGTVEPGKLADLLVIDGDPLADIGCLRDPSRVLAILKGGRFVKDELPSRASHRAPHRERKRP